MKKSKVLLVLTVLFTGMIALMFTMKPVSAADDGYGTGNRKAWTIEEDSWYCDRLEREVTREEVEERRLENREDCPRYQANDGTGGQMRGNQDGEGTGEQLRGNREDCPRNGEGGGNAQGLGRHHGEGQGHHKNRN